MKKNLSHIINVMLVPILFIFAIWIVKVYESISENYLAEIFAIAPGASENFLNIFTFPFVHAVYYWFFSNKFCD